MSTTKNILIPIGIMVLALAVYSHNIKLQEKKLTEKAKVEAAVREADQLLKEAQAFTTGVKELEKSVQKIPTK